MEVCDLGISQKAAALGFMGGLGESLLVIP